MTYISYGTTKPGQRTVTYYYVIPPHSGAPYKGIEKSDPPKKAQWSAAAIFEIEDGKVKSFTKDWDQKVMQVSFWRRCDFVREERDLLRYRYNWAGLL
jgi:hypothetical protein